MPPSKNVLRAARPAVEPPTVPDAAFKEYLSRRPDLTASEAKVHLMLRQTRRAVRESELGQDFLRMDNKAAYGVLAKEVLRSLVELELAR